VQDLDGLRDLARSLVVDRAEVRERQQRDRGSTSKRRARRAVSIAISASSAGDGSMLTVVSARK
jgi:hypothetical protein